MVCKAGLFKHGQRSSKALFLVGLSLLSMQTGVLQAKDTPHHEPAHVIQHPTTQANALQQIKAFDHHDQQHLPPPHPAPTVPIAPPPPPPPSAQKKASPSSASMSFAEELAARKNNLIKVPGHPVPTQPQHHEQTHVPLPPQLQQHVPVSAIPRTSPGVIHMPGHSAAQNVTGNSSVPQPATSSLPMTSTLGVLSSVEEQRAARRRLVVAAMEKREREENTHPSSSSGQHSASPAAEFPTSPFRPRTPPQAHDGSGHTTSSVAGSSANSHHDQSQQHASVPAQLQPTAEEFPVTPWRPGMKPPDNDSGHTASSSGGLSGSSGSHSSGPQGRAPDGTMFRPAGTRSYTVANNEDAKPEMVISVERRLGTAGQESGAFISNPAAGFQAAPGKGSLDVAPSTEQGKVLGGTATVKPPPVPPGTPPPPPQMHEQKAAGNLHEELLQAATAMAARRETQAVQHVLPTPLNAAIKNFDKESLRKMHEVTALEQLPFHGEEIEAPTKPVQGKPDSSLVTHPAAEPAHTETTAVDPTQNRLNILNRQAEQARHAKIAAHAEHEEEKKPSQAGGALGMIGMMGGGMMGGVPGGGEPDRPESFERQLHEQEGGHEHGEHGEHGETGEHGENPESGEQAAMMAPMVGGFGQFMPMGGMPMPSGGEVMTEEPVVGPPQGDDLMDRLIKWLKAYPAKVLELLRNVSLDEQKIDLIVPFVLDNAGNSVPLGVTIELPDQEKGVGNDPTLGFDPLETKLVAPSTFPVNGEDVPFDEKFLHEIVPGGFGDILADMMLLWGQHIWLLKMILCSFAYNARLATNQTTLDREAKENQVKVAAQADKDAAAALAASLQEQLAAHAAALQADADAFFTFNGAVLLSRFAHSADVQNANVAAGRVNPLSGPDDVLDKAPAALAYALDNVPMLLSVSMQVYANDYATVGFYDASLTKVVSDMRWMEGYNARTAYLRDTILPLITAKLSLSEKALILVAVRQLIAEYNGGFIDADDQKMVREVCEKRLEILSPVLNDVWAAMSEAKFGMFNTGDVSDFIDRLEKQRAMLITVDGTPDGKLTDEMARPSLEVAGSSADPSQVPLREFIKVWFICLMDQVVHARFEGGDGFARDEGFLFFDYAVPDPLTTFGQLLGLALRGASEQDGQTVGALVNATVPVLAQRAGSDSFDRAIGWLGIYALPTSVSGFTGATASIINMAISQDEATRKKMYEAMKNIEDERADAVLDKDDYDKISADELAAPVSAGG